MTSLGRAGGALRLGTPVSVVRWKKHAVEVRAGGRIRRAPAIIITLPLGVLQAGTVRFAPPLRAKQRIVRRLGWGQVARVTLRFDAGFWDSAVVPPELPGGGAGRISVSSRCRRPIFRRGGPPAGGAPLLVGCWAGGPRAVPLARLTPAQRVDRALRSLATAWNRPVTELRRHVREVWTPQLGEGPFHTRRL